MIGYPTTLTTSGQQSRHFSPSSSINSDVATLKPVIVALITRQKIICECRGRIGHKSDACIIRGQKSLPQSLSIKINQFNAPHGDETNEPPRYWNSQHPEAHFKYSTYPSKNNPVISDITGRLNYHTIDNGDVRAGPVLTCTLTRPG